MASAIISAASAPMRETSLVLDRPGGERKDRVAVTHRMRGVDRTRQSVMRHLSDFGRLGLGQSRIRGHDADGRVLSPRAARARPTVRSRRALARLMPSGRSDTGHDLPGATDRRCRRWRSLRPWHNDESTRPPPGRD